MSGGFPALSDQNRPIGSANWFPVCVTVFIILMVWFWYLVELNTGTISHFDEYYTYDRSLGFSRHNDWFAVYSNNEPSLKKPPLQYWFSGILLGFGVQDIIALRLPSMVFALGTLGATAILARVLIPNVPWAMPASVMLLSSSEMFWKHAMSAMLDLGATFFATLGMVAMFAAFARPRYWPYFAAVSVLAALQKAPTPLVFLLMALLALALTNRWQKDSFGTIVNNKSFQWAVAISFFMSFAWPIFQELRFIWSGSLDGSIKNQMFDRFAPSIAGRDFDAIKALILGNEPWLRITGFLGLCVLPFTTGNSRLWAAMGIGIIFVILMWTASGRVFSRYTLLILPLLSVGAAGALFSIRSFRWLGAIAIGGLIVSSGGPIKAQERLSLRSTKQYGMPLRDLLGPMSELLQENETLLVCATGRKLRIPPGAVSVYASNGRRFIYLNRSDVVGKLRRFGYVNGPLRGICPKDELNILAQFLTDLTMQPVADTDFVYWTSSGALVPQEHEADRSR